MVKISKFELQPIFTEFSARSPRRSMTVNTLHINAHRTKQRLQLEKILVPAYLRNFKIHLNQKDFEFH